MTRDELQKLRDLPIEAVAERLGLQPNRSHKCICPFHEDTHPSLSFHQGKNTYRCFVCGAHGGTIDLVMNHLHLDFKEACRWLTEPHPQPLSEREGSERLRIVSFDASRYNKYFERPWLSEPARQFLFTERRLDPRVISWCRLTSWTDRQGTPWLQIPYYDPNGHLIGIQNRNLAPCSTAPRFRFPQGSRCTIYNLPVLNRLQPHDDLWLAEGSSDCWAHLSAGHKAIAIPSATLLNPHDLQSLLSLPFSSSLTFHIYPDQDLPGERLYLQLRQHLPNLHRHQLPPGCKDYGELFKASPSPPPQ